MSIWLSQVPFDDSLERFEWQVRHARRRDGEWRKAKQSARAAQDETSRSERAFAFVFAAGALEDLFRQLDETIAADLQRVEIRPRDLRPSAISMLYPTTWDALSSDRVIRLVRRRGVIQTATDFYTSSAVIDLSTLERIGLADGRTVNVHHFEALWEGLCLSPGSEQLWRTPAHKQAVVTLADKRNAIAHFETDPRTEAFRMTYGDIATLLERISESVARLQEHVLDFLDRFGLP